MSEKDKPTKTLFRIIAYCTIIAICFNFIAFVSPFWIATKPSEHRQFQRLGLWTVCFDGYMRPYRYDRAYFGCYYIYYIEYDRIRRWLNPTWLYAVQVMTSLGLISHVISTFIVICQSVMLFSHANIKTLGTMLLTNFFTGLCLLLALIAFGVESQDSRWIQFPEYNSLSWSYAFAAIAFIITVLVFCLLVHLFLKVSADQEMIRKRKLHETYETYYTANEKPTGPYDPRSPPEMYNDV